MKSLELVFAITRDTPYRDQRMRIVCCELWGKVLAVLHDALGACEIRDVRARFAGVYGEIVQSLDLGMLDFRIPVSTLDQTHRDHAPCIRGEGGQMVDHAECALAVGLYDKGQAMPTCQRVGPS